MTFLLFNDAFQVTSEAPSIFRTAESLAMLDVLTSFSQLAIERVGNRAFCVILFSFRYSKGILHAYSK